VNEGVTNNAATLKPAGASTGALHITGYYTQRSHATLALDLGAKVRDLLAVHGAVRLAGRLATHNLGTHHPALGAKYRLLAGASLTYSIRCTSTSGTGSTSRHWAPSHTSTGLYLTWRTGARRHC
jgi:hypothetical protein